MARTQRLRGLLVEPKDQDTGCYEDRDGRVWFRFTLPGTERWVDFLADPYLEMLTELRKRPDQCGSYGMERRPHKEETTDDE